MHGNTKPFDFCFCLSNDMQKDEPVGKAGKAEQRDLTGAKEGEILTCGRRARPLRSTTVIS